MTDQIELEKLVRLACYAEVHSIKPGNVTPSHDFEDAGLADFCRSADAIAPVFKAAVEQSVGQTILQAVQATRAVVSSNTNLGIILLLAPLATVRPSQSLADGIETVLSQLSVEDSVLAYQAIQLAEPSGLGDADEQDIHEPPSIDLRACMQLAADRDFIARQYANGFHEVLCTGIDWLIDALKTVPAEAAVGMVALRLLAEFGDSLIQRKCGDAMNAEVTSRAADLLAAGWPGTQAGQACWQEFDAFLRADGNRRNPGTTADMIAAILFAAAREGRIRLSDGDFQISL